MADQKRRRGRPKEQNGSVVLSLRLPSDVLARVDDAVEASGYRFRDRSEFLRHTITEAVGLKVDVACFPSS